ncbi:hypothetical protein HYV82_05655 [Candidatus Woesearchaeota archaeon]|nr:hypothetical protein [Candidatus Woesearchaeota archaeon]
MNSAYLTTRPEHDDTTHYLSKWCEETLSLAQVKGFKVIDLHREKAVREEVESRLKRLPACLCVFNGHGSEDTVTGHKNEPLITADKNGWLLKSKIVYAISCKSAKVLGIKSIENGAISYTGYDDDFIFFYDPNRLSKPLADETAKLFLEHSNLFITSLLKGNSVEESRKRAFNKLKENMVKMLAGDSQQANLSRFLWWNMQHFVSHGNLRETL